MAARYKSDGESSDEEGQVSDTETFTDPPKQKNAGQLWTELVQSENLEEGLKSMLPIDDPSTSNSIRIDRGSESFQIPNNIAEESEKPIKSNKKVIDADDLFSSNDLQSEEFGVRNAVVRKQPELRSVHESYEPTGERDKRRWKRFKRIKAGIDSKMEVEKPKSALPTNRKRRMEEAVSMESLVSQQSGHSISGLGARSKHKKRKGPAENTILHQDFTFEKLYSASIPTGLDVENTGERIAQELGERDTVPIKFAVSQIGVENALILFNSTVQTEKNGGMQVKIGNRRRTPGGVFFELLKSSDKITGDVKKAVNEFSRNYFKPKSAHSTGTST